MSLGTPCLRSLQEVASTRPNQPVHTDGRATSSQMRPLFTVHAGEFVVGEFIEQSLPDLDVWVPAKDTGIDLLVTGKRGRPPISLQVKLSRDYKPFEARNEFEKSIVAAGWLTLDHDKLATSKADLWVVVLISHERKLKPQFLVIPPQE